MPSPFCTCSHARCPRDVRAGVQLDRAREQRIGRSAADRCVADGDHRLHRRAARDGEDADQRRGRRPAGRPASTPTRLTRSAFRICAGAIHVLRATRFERWLCAAHRRAVHAEHGMDFAGRTVVLTGVGREGQVGEAVAARLRRARRPVLLVDRPEDEARARARCPALLSGSPADRHSPCDLTDAAAVDLAGRRVRARAGGQVDALVHIAGGFAMSGPVAESDPGVLDAPVRHQPHHRVSRRARLLPLLRAARRIVVFFASEAVLPGAARRHRRYAAPRARVADAHARRRAGGARERRSRQRASRRPRFAPATTSRRWARRPPTSTREEVADVVLALLRRGARGHRPAHRGTMTSASPGLPRLASAISLPRMTLVARRRIAARVVRLDRSLEALPLFRLSDSADDGASASRDDEGGRWRVLPQPGDRLPGTFDQDVYVELMHRYHEAGEPADGAVSFTLHAFLRAMGRRVDGRTYEQLRGALGRLERTTLESSGIYDSGAVGARPTRRFTLLTAGRRSSAAARWIASSSRSSRASPPAEPGVARVVISPSLRDNLAARPRRHALGARYWLARLTGGAAALPPARGRPRRRTCSPGASPGRLASSFRSRNAIRRISSACFSQRTTCSSQRGVLRDCRRPAAAARVVRRLRAWFAPALSLAHRLWRELCHPASVPWASLRNPRRARAYSSGTHFSHHQAGRHAPSSHRHHRARAPSRRRRRVHRPGSRVDRRRARCSIRCSARQRRFVDTLQPGAALREGRARPGEGAQRSVQRAVHAQGAQAASRQQTNGKYGGIGMQIEQQQGAIIVSTRLPAHARRAGAACAKATTSSTSTRSRRAAGRPSRSPTRSSARPARRSRSSSRDPASPTRSSTTSRAR